jgi:hypothetical protein
MARFGTVRAAWRVVQSAVIGQRDPKDWPVMRLGARWRLVIGLACVAGAIAAMLLDFGTAKAGALLAVGVITALSGLRGNRHAPRGVDE